MGETSTIASNAASPLLDERALSKLHWRCRRGLLENDLFIEQFFTRFEPELTQRHADGLVRMMGAPDDRIGPLNLGNPTEHTIRELAETIMDVVGFTGRIVFDASKPDGTMRKVLDVSLLNAQHWQASKSLPAGIADTYKAYRSAL